MNKTLTSLFQGIVALVVLVGATTVSTGPASAATGSIEFDAASTTVAEGVAVFGIDLTRTDDSDAVSVGYVVSGANNNGSGGLDVSLSTGSASGTVNFAIGQATASIQASVSDDVNGEGPEAFVLTLQNPINLSIPADTYSLGAQKTHTLTISDNGDAGSIVFQALTSSVDETDSGTTTHSVLVTRAGGTEGAVTARVRSGSPVAGSATSGSDFVALDQTLSWANGVATAQAVNLSIINDNDVDANPNETVNLGITATTGGASVGANAAHTVTIVDNDSAGVISFSTTAATVGEADGSVTLDLTRTGGSDGTISAVYRTVNGSASAGSDFVGVPGTAVEFGPGVTSKSFNITILDDLDNDNAEQFKVALSGDVTGNVEATVSITDNDDPLAAIDDSYTTPEDTTLASSFSVLDNDTGPFGVTLAVQSFGTPARGTLLATNLAAGTFTYAPEPNFEGEVIFPYTVTDGFSTSTGEILIVVTDNNAAPVATNDSFPLVSRVDPTSLDVRANDTDQDGDALVITTLQIDTAQGNSVDCSTGVSCVFTPTVGFVGVDSFIYTLEDARGVSDTATVTVFVGIPRACDFTTVAGVAVVGTAGDDVICGSSGDDIIDGAGGNDYILGNGGNDILTGGAGRDLLVGGPGNDILRPGAGDNDDSLGGEGSDTVEYFGSNAGVSSKATGADTVIVDETSFTIDTINDTADPIEGTDDADSHEGVEKVVVSLVGGNDVITVSPSTSVAFELSGGSGTDRLNYEISGVEGVSDNGSVITATGQQPVTHTGFEIRQLDKFIREGTSASDVWRITSQPLAEGLILDQRESGDVLEVLFGSLFGPLAVNDTGVFGDDTLRAVGTSGVDQFEVRPRAVRTPGETVTFTGMEILQVQGGGGNDTFTMNLDAAFRSDALELDLSLDGGSGVDRLILTSDELCSVDNNGRVVVNGVGFFTVTNIETLEFDCGGQSGVISLIDGYWLVGSDGKVYEVGDVPELGDRQNPDAPVAGIEALVDKQGYWVAQADGNVAAFGTAVDHGDLPDLGIKPVSPIVDMAALVDGSGYYLLGADGGIFAFDAPFFGSTGNLRLDLPVQAMATSANGGYWFVASDGGIFAYGPGAKFYGSVPEYVRYGDLQADIVGMAATSSGEGYWLVAADGGVFAFGDAVFYGSVPGALAPGQKLNAPIVGMVATASGKGYYMVGADGGVFAFGDADFVGAQVVPDNSVVGLAG